MAREMVVSEKAIALWPYMGEVVEHINRAAEAGDLMAYNEAVVDAGEMARMIRRVTTVNMLKVQFRGTLWSYRREIRDVGVKRTLLERGVGKKGNPLAPSTLKQYETFVRCWPGRREKLKREIREKLREIEELSDVRGKIYIRGGVSLRVIKGGQYPARFHVARGDGWVKLR